MWYVHSEYLTSSLVLLCTVPGVLVQEKRSHVRTHTTVLEKNVAPTATSKQAVARTLIEIIVGGRNYTWATRTKIYCTVSSNFNEGSIDRSLIQSYCIEALSKLYRSKDVSRQCTKLVFDIKHNSNLITIRI